MEGVEIDSGGEELNRIPKPGSLIRKAREQRGYDREELSRRTRLTEAVILSVEADDYAALGQPVYARGYYRKCAEVLGLNGEALVDAYEKRSGTASPIPVIQQRPSIRYREGPGLAKVLLILVLLGSALGASAWWLLSQGPDAMPGWLKGLSSAPADAAPVQAVATPRPSPAAPAAEQRRADAPVPVAPAESRDGDMEQAPPVAAAAPAGSPAPVRQVEASVPAATPAATAPIDNPKLRIQIAGGDSWTEITDRGGNQLVYKLLPGGSEREVQGAAPFEVRLGRADLVRIWLDGEPLDIKPVIQPDLRARFRILGNGKVEG